MSDTPFPYQPPLMSAIRARNLSRIYKGLSIQLRREGFADEATQADRDAQWWITYAAALSGTPPGAIDKEW